MWSWDNKVSQCPTQMTIVLLPTKIRVKLFRIKLFRKGFNFKCVCFINKIPFTRGYLYYNFGD